jgi:hypothetical protein
MKEKKSGISARLGIFLDLKRHEAVVVSVHVGKPSIKLVVGERNPESFAERKSQFSDFQRNSALQRWRVRGGTCLCFVSR